MLAEEGPANEFAPKRSRNRPVPIRTIKSQSAQADFVPWETRFQPPVPLASPICQALTPMKLKLDLHAIYNDSQKIEASLQGIIDEAIEKRATEVEIIPGKGSGALKKTVLRFLDRPDIRACYHRVEKDGDNWGRLFVHFRFERAQAAKAIAVPRESVAFDCFCCAAPVRVPLDREALPETRGVDCPSCGSPNRLTVRLDRRGQVQATAESGYE